MSFVNNIIFQDLSSSNVENPPLAYYPVIWFKVNDQTAQSYGTLRGVSQMLLRERRTFGIFYINILLICQDRAETKNAKLASPCWIPTGRVQVCAEGVIWSRFRAKPGGEQKYRKRVSLDWWKLSINYLDSPIHDFLRKSEILMLKSC